MFKNVASQKIQLFAFDTTTGAPKTGDAANITAYVAKDYGTVTVLGDTSATEMDATNAKGWYLFDLTQAETNFDCGLFTGKSSTSNISIVGQVIYTLPASFTSFVTPTNLTAAQIATGVWQDTTAGDFTTALSVGKSVMNGVSLGTGLTVNAVTGLTASNLDATISSRMATYTQPTGFLAATFPSGTVANTTNITAGTIATVTTLTNLPSIPANWLTAAGIAAAALNGKGDWSTVTPTNLTAAQIATGVWQDTTAGDFTTALSVGKSLMNGVALGTGLTVNDITTKTGYALTSAYDFAKGTVAMTESYAANTVAPTPAQALFAIQQHLMDFAISGTSYTVLKLDHVTTAYIGTLDSAVTPTSQVRT